VALYGAAEGSASRRALVDQPTARQAVDAMLRDSARIFADQASPAGCLVTLGAVCGPEAEAPVRDHLRERRQEIRDLLRDRLIRGIDDGELGPGTDATAVAAFYNTVLQGLSLQARDGASRATLIGIVDCAMAAWDSLTGAGQITVAPERGGPGRRQGGRAPGPVPDGRRRPPGRRAPPRARCRRWRRRRRARG
jgi:hypothetical protein